MKKLDKPLYEQLLKKMEEIVNCPDISHYKNLRHDMKEYKRVHIGHFVLVFRHSEGNVYFEDFEHHDSIYLL